MTSKAPVVLILDFNANISSPVAQAFADQGYTIARVSSNANEEESTPTNLQLNMDLSWSALVYDAYKKVSEKVGAPSVVIYNAAPEKERDPKYVLGTSLKRFMENQMIDSCSAYCAIQNAAETFDQLPESASRTFVYIGPVISAPHEASQMEYGFGKLAAAQLVRIASTVYHDRGFRFYVADERTPEGIPTYNNVDGNAYGQYCLELAEDAMQRPWHQTFVKSVGYKAFSLAKADPEPSEQRTI